MLGMINRCYVFKFEFLLENSFLRWTVTLTPQKITYLILSWFFMQNYAGKTTLLWCFGDFWLYLIWTWTSFLWWTVTHTHIEKKLGYHLGMIFNEKLCRKKQTFLQFLPIFAVFHSNLNIFLVINSHTQLFFDFGMWGSKKSIGPDQGTSEQYESAVRILAPFFSL